MRIGLCSSDYFGANSSNATNFIGYLSSNTNIQGNFTTPTSPLNTPYTIVTGDRLKFVLSGGYLRIYRRTSSNVWENLIPYSGTDDKITLATDDYHFFAEDLNTNSSSFVVRINGSIKGLKTVKNFDWVNRSFMSLTRTSTAYYSISLDSNGEARSDVWQALDYPGIVKSNNFSYDAWSMIYDGSTTKNFKINIDIEGKNSTIPDGRRFRIDVRKYIAQTPTPTYTPLSIGEVSIASIGSGGGFSYSVSVITDLDTGDKILFNLKSSAGATDAGDTFQLTQKSMTIMEL